MLAILFAAAATARTLPQICPAKLSPIDLKGSIESVNSLRGNLNLWRTTAISITSISAQVFEITSAIGFGLLIGETGEYQIERIYFKFPSEHLVNHERYPMEIQVYAADAFGQLMIFSIIAVRRRKPVFHPLEDWGMRKEVHDLARSVGGSAEVPGNFYLGDLFDTSNYYARYDGESTTEPCQPAKWLVSNSVINLHQDFFGSLDTTTPVVPVTTRAYPLVSQLWLTISAQSEPQTLKVSDNTRKKTMERVAELLAASSAPLAVDRHATLQRLDRLHHAQLPCPPYLQHLQLFPSPAQLPRNCVYPWSPELLRAEVPVGVFRLQLIELESRFARSFRVVCYIKNLNCSPLQNYVPMIGETTAAMSGSVIAPVTALTSLPLYDGQGALMIVRLPEMPAEDAAGEGAEAEDGDAATVGVQRVEIFWPRMAEELLPADCVLGTEGVPQRMHFLDVPRPVPADGDYRFTLLAACPTRKATAKGAPVFLPLFVLTHSSFVYAYRTTQSVSVPGPGGAIRGLEPRFAAAVTAELIDVDQLADFGGAEIDEFILGAVELQEELKAEYFVNSPMQYQLTAAAAHAISGGERPNTSSSLLNAFMGALGAETEGESDDEVIKAPVTGLFIEWSASPVGKSAASAGLLARVDCEAVCTQKEVSVPLKATASPEVRCGEWACKPQSAALVNACDSGVDFPSGDVQDSSTRPTAAINCQRSRLSA